MPADVDVPASPPTTGFELDHLELVDDRLVVSGRWFGVRGMRFVRPTLIIGGRSVLATMAHKPWAPDADPWRAEFPWVDGPVDAEEVVIAVTPRLVVPLAGDAEIVEEPPARASTRFVSAPTPEVPVSAAPALPDPALPDPALPDPALPDPALVAARAERDRRAAEAEEARRRLQIAERERDHALERLAEAERDRHAALRTRGRMSDSSDVAERERVDALARQGQEQARREAVERERALVQAELNRSERERDAAERAVGKLQSQLERGQTRAAESEAARAEAEAERDRIRGQRDETLLAYDTLQRQRRTELGSLPPAEPVAAEPAMADAAPADADADAAATVARAHEDPDIPLGVRRVPAARGSSADLLAAPARSREVSTFDVWAMRILGSVAAGCFILLMVLILRAFLL